METPVLEDSVLTKTSTSGASSLSMTAPTGIVAGELLVLFMMSDSINNGEEFNDIEDWRKAGEGGNNSARAHAAIFYKIADGTEGDVTSTVKNAEHYLGWYCRVSGADTLSPIDVKLFGTSVANSSAHVVGGLTTKSDKNLVIGALSGDGGDMYPFSISGTGFSEVDDAQISSSSSVASGVLFQRDLDVAGKTGDVTVTSSASDGATWFQIAIVPPGFGTVALVSDPFTGTTLDPAWTFYNPGLADGSYNLTDPELEIVVPAATGGEHDAWSPDGIEAPHLMQANANTDFEIEVEMKPDMSVKYQLQGILVKEDLDNFIRFDFYHDGVAVRIFAGSVSGASNASYLGSSVTLGATEKLKMRRVGDVFTVHRYEGGSWVRRATFTKALTVTEVGIFCGNSPDGSNSPAYTGSFVSFADTDDPI